MSMEKLMFSRGHFLIRASNKEPLLSRLFHLGVLLMHWCTVSNKAAASTVELGCGKAADLFRFLFWKQT